jgi:hypothetical protein
MAFARFFRRWQVREGYVNFADADADLFDDGPDPPDPRKRFN